MLFVHFFPTPVFALLSLLSILKGCLVCVPLLIDTEVISKDVPDQSLSKEFILLQVCIGIATSI